MVVSIKNNQIDFQIDDLDKEKLEKAAQLNHLSLTAYISSTILKQADLDIKNNETLLLNKEDSSLIMKLLDSQMEPNEKLVRLFK